MTALHYEIIPYRTGFFKRNYDSDSRLTLFIKIPTGIKISIAGVSVGVDGVASSSFSKYRERLIYKGIIKSTQHGEVELLLPRFSSVAGVYN